MSSTRLRRFWIYLLFPTSTFLMLLAFFGASFDLHQLGDRLRVTEKSNPYPGRYVVKASSFPSPNGGDISRNDDYPESFYKRTQIGDTLFFGMGFVLALRRYSIVAIDLHWPVLLMSLPFFGWSSFVVWIGSRQPTPQKPFTLDLNWIFFEYRSLTSSSRFFFWLKYLSLTIPFLLPWCFFYLYDPINCNWTVKRFGCGCPKLDGSYTFNANHFNLCLWCGFFALFTTLWVWRYEKIFSPWPPVERSYIGSAGVTVLMFLSLVFCGRGMWL